MKIMSFLTLENFNIIEVRKEQESVNRHSIEKIKKRHLTQNNPKQSKNLVRHIRSPKSISTKCDVDP